MSGLVEKIHKRDFGGFQVAEGADETVDFAAIYKYIYDPAAGDSSTEDT